jgi:hypothetical protein
MPLATALIERRERPTCHQRAAHRATRSTPFWRWPTCRRQAPAAGSVARIDPSEEVVNGRIARPHEDHHQPVPGVVANLVGQFALGAELRQAREGDAAQAVRFFS